MASSEQSNDSSISHTVALLPGDSLSANLPSAVGAYAFVVRLNTMLISFHVSLNSFGGMFYPTLVDQLPVALISSTAVSNGVTAGIQLTGTNGTLMSVVFDQAPLGVYMTNDHAVDSLLDLCFCVTFMGMKS